MRYLKLTAIAFMLAAVPAALPAQASSGGANPVERLLSHRAELSLTANQVKRLEEIHRSTAAQDAELRQKLEALRGRAMGEPLRMREMSPEQREQLQANRAEMQPLMRQIRTVHEEAAADARAVLTPEQNARAGEFMYNGRGQGLGRGPAAGSGLRQRMRLHDGRGPGGRW